MENDPSSVWIDIKSTDEDDMGIVMLVVVVVGDTIVSARHQGSIGKACILK